MIQIVMSPKGSGKTKSLIEKANEALSKCNGDIVFITNNDHYIYDIKREIRMINTTEFDIRDYKVFYGFICGIISEDYDISEIFIDNIMKIVNIPIEKLGNFLSLLESVTKKFNIVFSITISGDPKSCPEDLRQYLAS